jgi:hypothetical protein
MRNLLALLLLFATGLGLIAGPHPCHARQARPDVAERSCHMQAKAAGPSTGPSVSTQGQDCCGGHGSLCENACQTVAVVDAQLPRMTMEPLALTVAPVFDRSLPLFSHAIDHIPLA